MTSFIKFELFLEASRFLFGELESSAENWIFVCFPIEKNLIVLTIEGITKFISPSGMNT